MKEDIQKFVDFLDSYKSNYLDSISNISKPRLDNSDECRVESNLYPLVNCEKNMLDFDTMCCESKYFKKDNIPHTVDALYYQVDDEGDIFFYLIEFKGAKLDWDHEKQISLLEKDIKDTLDNIKNSFEWDDNKLNEYFDDSWYGINYKLSNLRKYTRNKVESSLILKVFESLYVTLPSLYEEYCSNRLKIDPNYEPLNLIEFFMSDLCYISLFIVGKFGNENNADILDRDENKSRFYGKLMCHKLRTQYYRLKKYYPNILSDFYLLNKNSFNNDLKFLYDEEKNCIKTLLRDIT